MIKDTNEVLKFLVFMINMLIHTHHSRTCMNSIINVVQTFTATLGAIDVEKLFFIFKNFFLQIILEKFEKAADITQYCIIKMVYAFSDMSEKFKAETLQIIIQEIKSRESLYKFFEVWTAEEKRSKKDVLPETIVNIIKIVQDTKINNSVNQRAYFFKILINLSHFDFFFVEKLFFAYEDLFNEKHNEALITVIMFFYVKFYHVAFQMEMNILSQDKTLSKKEPKNSPDPTSRIKIPSNLLNHMLKKMDELLQLNSAMSRKVFFLHMAELIDSSLKLLEIYILNLLKLPQEEVSFYLNEKDSINLDEDIEDLYLSKLSDDEIWLKPELLSDDLRFGWILMNNPIFSRNVICKNSSSILSLLLKSISIDNKKINESTFWYLLRVCFNSCKFEALNFEYFDFIMNSAFLLIVQRFLNKVYNSNMEEIFKIIVRYEIKREVCIKDFDPNFEKLLNNSPFKTALTELMKEIYVEIEDNDIYSSSFKARFGPLINV